MKETLPLPVASYTEGETSITSKECPPSLPYDPWRTSISSHKVSGPLRADNYEEHNAPPSCQSNGESHALRQGLIVSSSEFSEDS